MYLSFFAAGDTGSSRSMPSTVGAVDESLSDDKVVKNATDGLVVNGDRQHLEGGRRPQTM